MTLTLVKPEIELETRPALKIVQGGLSTLKIQATSDIHGGGKGGVKTERNKRRLPTFGACDVAIIAGDTFDVYGDHSPERQADELSNKLLVYFSEIPAKHVILIAGNHDFLLQTVKGKKLMREYMPENFHYLEDEAIEIDGKTFYGTPWTPNLPGWAFQAEEIAAKWTFNKIPRDLDVLISHGPPFGYGDQTSYSHAGSEVLLREIYNKKPKIVVCGHIHEGFGHYRIPDPDDKDKVLTDVYCVSYLNRNYEPTNEPVEIEI